MTPARGMTTVTTVSLEAPIGTPHRTAVCCWCARSLVVAEVLRKRCWLCPVDWKRQAVLALTVTPMDKEHAKILGVPTGERVCLNVPLPSQAVFEECQAKNILWGGQAGPGKSHGVRWWLYKRSLTAPKHEALLTRENWEQLEKTHMRRMQEELPMLGAEMVGTEARFSNRSFIDCGHMADAKAVNRYLSTEYGAIVPDEASQYPVTPEGVTPLAELSTRARKVYVDRDGATVGPKFVPVTNPGGPSAAWLRDFFIDHTPDFEAFPQLRSKYDPAQWVYIPARLDDNPYLDQDYETSLAVLSKWRYEQLRHGDWDVFSGQFFSEWTPHKHVQTLAIGPGIEWFASLDWGYNAPGVCLWWACLSDGHYHIAREHKFVGKSAETVAGEIRRITHELRISQLRYVAADPSMWAKTGHGRGESVAETLQRRGLPMRRGDNDRLNGWLRCHELLADAPDGTPWITVAGDPHCKYLRRSLPAQVSDKHDPDDINTGGDDHAVDALRYGAMSRPAPTRFRKPDPPMNPMLAELLAGQAASPVLGRQNVRRAV